MGKVRQSKAEFLPWIHLRTASPGHNYPKSLIKDRAETQEKDRTEEKKGGKERVEEAGG